MSLLPDERAAMTDNRKPLSDETLQSYVDDPSTTRTMVIVGDLLHQRTLIRELVAALKEAEYLAAHGIGMMTSDERVKGHNLAEVKRIHAKARAALLAAAAWGEE